MFIKIKLLSDTIPYSGQGLSGIIDTDVFYDEFGIPYIPAKRIKGLLKENAMELLDNGYKIEKKDIDYLFGKSGDKVFGNLRISNAYINNYENIKNNIKSQKDKTLFNKERIISYYTYLRNQTSIDENGVALKNSLRTSRVLKKNLEFVFKIDFDEKYKSFINDLLKITRSMGLKRNRGFGEIFLEEIKEIESKNEVKLQINYPKYNDEDLYEISIRGIAKEGLIVNTNFIKKEKSENFIPGSFILGFLANKYLQKKGKDNFFTNLFLKKEVIFNNFYIQENNREYIPCPLSIQKIKDSDDIVDLTFNENDNKILKGTVSDLVSIENENLYIKNLEKEINYHHKRPVDRSLGKSSKEEGEFFQYECLKEDNEFVGTIIGKYKYLKILLDLLNENGVIYLGRSKNSQYGSLNILEIKLNKLIENLKQIEKNSNLVLTFKSDIILRNPTTGYITNDLNILKKELSERFKVDFNDLVIVKSFIKTKFVGGFLSVWGLPKQQIECISAGSEIIIKNNKTFQINKLDILKGFGERTNEGFGQIILNYHGNKKLNKQYIEKNINTEFSVECPEFKAIKKYLFEEKLKEILISTAMKKINNAPIKINKSFLYRLNNIFQTSESLSELKSKLEKMGKSRVKELEKLKAYLWMSNQGSNITIDINNFIENKEFQNLIKELGELTEEKKLEFYKFYVSNLFTLLIYKSKK
ncbi:MAG: RAMP superfamily CRISPR-associated protein [candidate division WOR-3 bacterium]